MGKYRGLTHTEYQALWRRKRKEQGTYSAFRREHHLRQYGLTTRRYEEMVAEQKGVCAICYQPAKLYVDHDHESDEVRGLLCSACNVGLGHFRENPRYLMNAMKYLKR